MRGRAIIPLVVGLGVGLMAVKVFVNVLQKAKGATSETVPAVFATANIEPTLEIQESMLEVRHVPKEAMPETGFTDKAEVVGRVTNWAIPKGSFIAGIQLAPKGTPPGMAVRISAGHRAVAVKVDESVGVAGWIKPGSRVDVVALLSSPERGSNESISKVILQNVEVLAVGQDIGKAGDTGAAVTKTVTLLVSPQEVPKLHLAETKGKLRLAMRNQQDSSLAQTNLTTDNDLVSLGSSAAEAAKSTSAGLLGAFLTAQAKYAAKQTDKEQHAEAAPVTPADPEPVAPPAPWCVEVHKGVDEVATVKFERDAANWNRVEGQTTRSSRPRPATPARAAAVPAPAAAPHPGILPEAKANKPQVASPVLEGPAGTQ